MKQKIYIKENSWIAKAGAKLLKVKNVALTIGNTIYLHNASKQDLLNNKNWLTHELVHVKQYQKAGKIFFLFRYFFEWVIKGYKNISYEMEAVANEHRHEIIDEYYFEIH